MPNFSKAKGGAAGEYYNPFYNQVDKGVKDELAARAKYVGATVRSGVNDAVLEWSYRKTAYGHVKAGGKNGMALGFDGPRAMTDKSGNLTLYDSTRNVPAYPLLQSIDITNDGTVGSLLRGKFNFTYWPKQNTNSFNMQKVSNLFFVPGKEVQLSWGWSVGGLRNNQAFTGIINNFNWSYNIDLSMNAEVSIVSAASISIGISGDQTKAETDPNSKSTDGAGAAIAGINIASIIDSDLAAITGSNKNNPKDFVMSVAGQTAYVAKELTKNNILDYLCIGWPYADENSGGANIQTFWYTSVTRFVQATNTLIDQFEKGGAPGLGSIFQLQVDGNTTQHLPNIKSSYPQDVIFPSEQMGSYGGVKPGAWTANSFGFNPAKLWNGKNKFDVNITKNGARDSELINIGGILISVNYIKDTYRNFIQENAANISYRNITKFVEDVLKRINVASGDMYQFSAVLCDNPDTMKGRSKYNNLEIAILSIEDTNISSVHSDSVTPFPFEGNIFKPLIKNINISSKPPGPLAAAAFTKARGSRNANNDTPVSQNKKPEEPKKTQDEMDAHLAAFASNGFNEKWSETYRGLQSRLKKVSAIESGKKPHWLTKVIYPVELSITIDGISGFSFGNIIKTNLLPKEYVDAEMVFAITKIDHKITPHIWETTLHTVCRLDANSPVGTASS
jgi:hypothetical protein